MFTRYAVYFTPMGDLAEFGARWLGWDVATGMERTHPDAPGLDVTALTKTPRKYGLHGTIKPPFRLRDGLNETGLQAALADFCATTPRFDLDGLALSRIGRFLALVPVGDTSALSAMAARAVTELDGFRAPLTDAELAKRRKSRLTPAQDQHLLDWGYPYVMDQFRFHITMSGPVNDATAQAALAVLEPLVAPVLPTPFGIDGLTLAGEDINGFFHKVHRYTFTG